MPGLKFNTSGQNITFALINTSGAPLASATVSTFVSKDGGAQVNGGGSSTYLGNGQYNYAPATSETSGTACSFLFSASGGIIENLMFLTDKVDGGGLVQVDVVDIAGAALSTTSAQLGVNVVQYNGQTAQTDANNLPKVDLEDVGGTALVTHAAGMVPADLYNISGAAVSTSTAQLGVNVVNISGAAINTSTAQLGVNVVSVAGAASNIKKNQALSNFGFVMTSSISHAPMTGLAVTATRSINGGSFAACANAVTEIANGWYQINLAASDLNGNTILLRFTATGADDRDIEIITQP